MNKNSYVTAALFVVFVLLTVFYMGMEDPKDLTTGAGSTQTFKWKLAKLMRKQVVS